ncbi:glycerol-3-phosphate O-acyltransferase / dihydroxyacetone phosphate acyltransferase [Entomortierella parvispora]|uniref:Glycerol-3-phosphate O-acyltransferase / dihydroxyacetone phosphate acyltransferase n=1 Tax=Entomortierella parvispora TaxID=205924 RepID=A0A9P3HJI4_9FUNG|nr:glycerol-3-phosphate O-acyltransferase / dihydroxyacetone phosphate acyltransferase [Entomortierella parvispora]
MGIQIYDFVSFFFTIMLDIFFREIRPRGAHKIPQKGPVIFVAAPHANQFVDPLVLMRECGRRVSFLAAKKSMDRRWIGAMARAMNAIPVERPQDLAKSGSGTIKLQDRRGEPLRITGLGTKFTKELMVGDQISLPKDVGTSAVAEIISDTELIVKKEFKELKALELLTLPEGTKYKCMPHMDQSNVYKTVFERLNAGHCVGIFPEGGSHDRAEMLPLKAGVTIMALGALAANPSLDLKIVTCGLNYFHPHRFRSRAVVEFGEPLTVPPELVEMYKKGGAEKREACGKLLDTIYEALRGVTLNAPDYETLMVIQAARRLYKPTHRKLQISQVVELNRRFVAGYMHFKDNPKVIEAKDKVMHYNTQLRYHGLRDHQVNIKTTRRHAIGMLLSRVIQMIFLSCLALPGTLMNLPVAIVARVISNRKAKEALAASTVKIAGRDVLATWKLLVALGLMPVLYFSYSVLVFIYCGRFDISFTSRLLIAWAAWACIPFVTYASIRFGEQGIDIFKSIRPLFLSIIPGEESTINDLRAARAELRKTITDLINELAPEIYPDFDSTRILDPSPNDRPSRSVSGTNLAQTIFNTAALPINQWLGKDGRFEWERAEDSDDADDVFFFLNPARVTGQGRSRASSWGGVYTPAGDGSRSRNRSRTSSFTSGQIQLGEGFKLEALTELPKDKPFAEVTRRLSLSRRNRYGLEGMTRSSDTDDNDSNSGFHSGASTPPSVAEPVHPKDA